MDEFIIINADMIKNRKKDDLFDDLPPYSNSSILMKDPTFVKKIHSYSEIKKIVSFSNLL